MESWTEIRCPACVELGYPNSKLLYTIEGKTFPMPGAVERIKCSRCKSMIGWHIGTPMLFVIEEGAKLRKKQKIVYENIDWEEEKNATEAKEWIELEDRKNRTMPEPKRNYKEFKAIK